ncbi:hypothetical protein P3T97_04255 [Mammaliicoccus sciuri]|uniref:hypothetical protein n=1 Tax=Mammaliicoccus sciuri TaxID=1296 RepID=UPI002B25AADE|nr:hypothetical protein [Mammaliicoccus sciuri]WQJ66634.1 hypothetical protein P3T97_04255 [Mammaliicoccus sciuri]
MIQTELTKDAQNFVLSHIKSKKDKLCDCLNPDLKVSPEILTLYGKSDHPLQFPADFIITACNYCGKSEFYPLSLFKLETIDRSNP